MNLLFVCSRNQWRSPTGEAVWRNREGVRVRSAGTSGSAKRKLTARDLRWADLVFVMEEKHRQIVMKRFGRRGFEGLEEKLHVLDIEDDYQFMDPELVEMFEQVIPHFIVSHQCQ